MECTTSPRLVARQAIADVATALDPGAYVQHFRHDVASLSREQQEYPHPLSALRSGALLLKVAREELVRAALDARAQGESWSSIAEALGMTVGEEADAEAAYLSTLGVRGSAVGTLGVLWTCGSCAATVRDLGPELDDPVQREPGHADTCGRHVREIIAWRSEAQQ
jgi:hypothetical protein